jgi:hypothetical protein
LHTLQEESGKEFRILPMRSVALGAEDPADIAAEKNMDMFQMRTISKTTI